MKPTLLHIDSSPLADSVSREVTRAFASSWTASHPHGDHFYRDLAAEPPAVIDSAWIGGARTSEKERSAQQQAALTQSDKFIAELQHADEYVIGVAMHNFSIPSVLKLWIDQIVRSGRTFAYGAAGPQGLLTGKKATIVIASGGVYKPGTPMGALDFAEPYLRMILGFIGVQDVTFIKVGGTAALHSGTVTRGTLLQPALEQVHGLTV
jgi:FMN-dependent NADH-azoreductase